MGVLDQEVRWEMRQTIEFGKSGSCLICSVVKNVHNIKKYTTVYIYDYCWRVEESFENCYLVPAYIYRR